MLLVTLLLSTSIRIEFVKEYTLFSIQFHVSSIARVSQVCEKFYIAQQHKVITVSKNVVITMFDSISASLSVFIFLSSLRFLHVTDILAIETLSLSLVVVL